MGETVSIAMKKDICENAFFTNLGVEEIDIDDVPFCDAVLSTAGFDDCERHGLGKGRGKSHDSATLTSGNSRVCPLDEERDLALRRVGFIMGQQVCCGAAPEFLEFLR